MRTALLLATALLLSPLAPVGAQRSRADSAAAHRGPVPRVVAREALAIYNDPQTIRSLGPYVVDSGRVIQGDVAVVDGPVTVAGQVAGRLVAINADVRLLQGARVDGDLLVIGGVLSAEGGGAPVGGDVRVYRERLAYLEQGDVLVPADTTGGVQAGLEELWAQWRTRDRRSGFRFNISSAKTYNRVEGLPILAGPEYRGPRAWGETRLRVFGVFRTADEFRWDSRNLGHDVSGELRLGRQRGVTLGGGLYDLVRPVEDWQLDADEVGWASFILRRDFRDYFDTHGARMSVGFFAGADADVTLSLADERWGSRDSRDPFTLFRNGSQWRANPAADAGRFHVADVKLHVDTRNVVDRPWSGLYLVADYEHGSGRVSEFAGLSPGVRPTDDPRVAYGRGFLDARRYSRISPGAQINVRLVAAGWLHGDPLPAQRRLSLGGAGTLPGYDFRGLAGGADVGQCSTTLVPAGSPAQCDRVVLAQVEYRGDLHLHDFGRVGDWLGRGWRHDAQWVAFANSGRGWLVSHGQPEVGAPLQLSSGSLPGLESFRTDLGLGVDLGLFGIYVSRGISDPGQRTNFYLRLHERF